MATKKIYKANQNVEYPKSNEDIPCFGINTIVSCFIEQLDYLVQSQKDDICMVGVFGAWGRGKTYFFDKVESFLSTRKEKKLIKYTVIRFNAWKYQDTPALWAYLYETIKSNNTWWTNNVCLFFRENWINILRVCCISVVILIGCFFVEYIKNIKLPHWIIWTTPIIPVIERFLKYMHNNRNTWLAVKCNTRHINMLGYQNVVENDLERLLSVWISDKHLSKERIILHIDDLDRCEDVKIMSVLDSLRTILENEQIKKRLIIICNLDKDRLKSAISQKYRIDMQENVFERLVEKQIDKLFVFSLGLPQLSVNQQKSYIETLHSNSNTSANSNPYDETRENGSLLIKDSDTVETEITEQDLKKLIQDYIDRHNNHNIKLTPREMRIIYYRLIFANRIIASGNSPVYISQSFVDKIIKKSISNDCQVDIRECFSDILEIVVPY